MKYHDANGTEIKAGDVLQHADGEKQKVYACGDDDLGFNASNEDFLKAHPEATREFYPLYQFNTQEWIIIESEKEKIADMKEIVSSVPREVKDFAHELSRLRKDTGISVLSFDWSEPMLEHAGGDVFILDWDEESEQYVPRKMT